MGTPEKAISFLTDLTSWHSKNFRPDTTNNFDSNALAGMIITDVSPGRMLCELAVTPRVQNRFGSLHGGCIGEPAKRDSYRGCSDHTLSIVQPVITAYAIQQPWWMTSAQEPLSPCHHMEVSASACP